MKIELIKWKEHCSEYIIGTTLPTWPSKPAITMAILLGFEAHKHDWTSSLVSDADTQTSTSW